MCPLTDEKHRTQRWSRAPLWVALPLLLSAGLPGCGVAPSGDTDASTPPDTASAADASIDPPDAAGADDLAMPPDAPPADLASADGGSEDDAGMPADAGIPDGAAMPADAAMPAPARGRLHTKGADIVDERGRVVRLTGINWFGMETANFAPHGLWSRSMASMLDQVAGLGYNTLRVPYCNQLFDRGSAPNGINQNENPDLVGLDGLGLLDKLVEAAGRRGLRVVLDRHRPDANAQSALWYTADYSEQRWIADWVMLARRYRGDPTVVGADLHNEPHDPATWGDGNLATDWRLAAERAGSAILAEDPDLLIIVEGVQTAGGSAGWWGGTLRGAEAAPVRLAVADRLVYSAHDYPPSIFRQPWFDDPQYPKNLPAVWDAAWGHLARKGIAPVWLGEFGTRYESQADKQWMKALVDYLGPSRIGFAFWCLNPNSGDTGGILLDDWRTVHAEKQALIAPLLAPRF